MMNLVTALLLAHIKLSEPMSFQVTDGLGAPQKLAPCGGDGEATTAVTTVEAGSQLTVSWKETIYHPGHFRISIAKSSSEFVTPEPVLNNGACGTAPVENPVAYPTVVDGLFEHSSAGSGDWSTSITVPSDLECDHCVLQLMQFMSKHPTPCFYYQCATLKIVKPGSDAGLGLHYEGDPPTQSCGCGSAGGAVVALAMLLIGRRARGGRVVRAPALERAPSSPATSTE